MWCIDRTETLVVGTGFHWSSSTPLVNFPALGAVSFKPSHIRCCPFRMHQRTLASALGFFTFDHVLMLLADGNGINETMGGLTMRVVHVLFSHLYQKHVGHTLVFIACVYYYDWLCKHHDFSRQFAEFAWIITHWYFSDTYRYVDRNLTDQSCKPIGWMNV